MPYRNKEDDAACSRRYRAGITNTCAIGGCERLATSKVPTAMCHMHRERLKARGDVGDLHPNRTGRPLKSGPITYAAAHYRVISARGPASLHKCLGCGNSAAEWSYRGGSVHETFVDRTYEATGRTFRMYFSPEPDDYDPRCRSCHKVFDAALATKRLEDSYAGS